MAGNRRNPWLAGLLAAATAIGAATLPSGLWTFGLASLLALAGVVLLRGNRWRSGALLVAALALSMAFLDAMAGWLAPRSMGLGVVHTTVPAVWTPSEPILGYHPQPDTAVLASATFGAETIFRVTYTIDASGARVTPPAPPGADTYIFMGDSFMFGEGLADDQSLPAQFAKANDFKVRTVNLAAPGYGPNNLVRAFEAGLLDRFIGQPVKAVVIWIIPEHLARVTGDRPWLGSSPRYVLENGLPHHTGSFQEHRWRNPGAGLLYLAGEQLVFVKALGARQREAEQAELFLALIERLRSLARERLGASLIVVYSWPDDHSWPGEAVAESDLSPLQRLMVRLRRSGVAMLPVDRLTRYRDLSLIRMPHDGHPSAFTNQLIAFELKRRLIGP